MKQTSRTLCAALAAAALCSSAHADLPVSFKLAVDPTGVALQFDVTSESPLNGIGLPTFEGTSNHDVRSATLESGDYRFVVFSQTGEPLAATGEVNIVFSSDLIPSNGAITIANVTASDASGDVVAASPNALPVMTQRLLPHQSLELGDSLHLDAFVYDLDGSIKSVQLFTGANELDADTDDPFTLAWTPETTGAYPISVVALDNLDSQNTFDLGIYRSFTDSEILDYANFSSIHFGSSSGNGAFDADPNGLGLGNGLAYLLGVNPYHPDFSRFPRSRLEKTDTGIDLVLSFIRRSNVTGVDWNARLSSNFNDYQDVDPERVSESDNANGSHSVEIRLPLDMESADPTFVDLEIKQSS